MKAARIERPYLRKRDWPQYFGISESEADRLSRAFAEAYDRGELQEDDLIKGPRLTSAKKETLRRFYAKWIRRRV